MTKLNNITLKMIGYWPDSFEKQGIPDYLVEKYDRNQKDKIVRYLKSGVKLFSEFGYSFCRINCGIRDDLMGDGDLSDGVWEWPEGLAHYIEDHDIILPEEFVEFIKCKNYEFTIPEEAMAKINYIKQNQEIFLLDKENKNNMDITYWSDWLQEKESYYLTHNKEIHYIKMSNNNKPKEKISLNIPTIKK